MISTIKSTWRSWPTESWVPVLLVITLFAVPVSSTAKSICIPLVVALILFTEAYRRDLVAVLYQPWCQATLLLFFLALIACAWGPASLSEKMLVLEKYSKLIYLPILAVGFRDEKTRRMAIYAFLIVMTITCLVSMGKVTGVLRYHGDESDFVFRNHTMTAHMMVLATYLFGLQFIQQRGKMRIVYATMILLLSYQTLFISTGRTGYIMYALLMFLLLVQTLSWRKALLAILVCCSVLTASYYQSVKMQTSVQTGIAEWQHFQEDKDTHIGYRLQFHAFAKEVYQRHPWFGNGTGSFTATYRQENPVPSWSRTLLEPHSQYWLVAVEFGAVGILVLFCFLGTLLVASLGLRSMRPVALAVILPFVVGNFTDSLLFYSGSGYFFLVFMALCLGEQLQLITDRTRNK